MAPQEEVENVMIASTESPSNGEKVSPTCNHDVAIRSQSLLVHPIFSSHVLPTHVPCTGGPAPRSDISRAITTSLPHSAEQAAVVSLRYPHMALPSNSPPYLFSDTIFTPNTSCWPSGWRWGSQRWRPTRLCTGLVTPALSWPVTGSLRDLRKV